MSKQVAAVGRGQGTPKEVAAAATEAGLSGKKVMINIAIGNDKSPRRQFVGLNGAHYLIERGKDVPVPVELLGVLDDAVETVSEQDPEDDQKSIMVERKRFPYTIIGAVQ